MEHRALRARRPSSARRPRWRTLFSSWSRPDARARGAAGRQPAGAAQLAAHGPAPARWPQARADTRLHRGADALGLRGPDLQLWVYVEPAPFGAPGAPRPRDVVGAGRRSVRAQHQLGARAANAAHRHFAAEERAARDAAV